jgi:cytoskeleton protein RodZ
MPEGPPAQTVGARLREAREQRGLSLRQIASRTRISVISLEALERDDLTRLPGGIFTRAFIRAYAKEVGLDPDRTIQDFISELPPESAAVTAHSVIVEDGEKLESDRKAVATAIRLALISLPLAVLIVYYGVHRAEPSAARSVRDARSASQSMSSPGNPPPSMPVTAEPMSAGEPSASVAPAAAIPAAPVEEALAAGLTMVIAPKGDCWVSVTTDGEHTFSILMREGEKRQVTANDEISLNVGDAGAFAYTLNGRPGRPLGAPGEVVSRRIRLADVKSYVN